MFPDYVTKDLSRRKPYSRDVSDKLAHRIASGQYEVGEQLPTERLLSLEFGVNRHAIREALKRLEAMGLIRIKHGVGIFVEPLQYTGGLELFDIMLIKEDGAINQDFLRDALEFRRHLTIAIVRQAVQRRTPRELGAICRLVDELCYFRTSSPDAEHTAFALSEEMVKAAHNQIYQMTYNSLERLFFKLRDMYKVSALGMEESEAVMQGLRKAFEESDPDRATTIVGAYLDRMEQSVLSAHTEEAEETPS